MMLKQRAKVYTACEGQVRFYVLPFHPVSFNIALEWGKAQWGPSDKWGPERQGFCLLPPCTVDIEFDSQELPEEWEALRSFWTERQYDHEADWRLFSMSVTRNVLNEWYLAYDAARKTNMNAPAVLQSEPDAADQKKDAPPKSTSETQPKPTPKAS